MPYIKLSPEDIEAHAMQRLLKMPVLSSSAPSSVIWSAYDYGQLPSADFDEFGYRMRSYAKFLGDTYILKYVEPEKYK